MNTPKRYRDIIPVGPGKLLSARTVWKQTPTATFSFLLSRDGTYAAATAKELAERIVAKFSAGIGLSGVSFVAFTRTFSEPAKLSCFVQFICTMNSREWTETQSKFLRQVMENLSTGDENELLPSIFDEAMFWMLTKHGQEPTNGFALRKCEFGVAMQTLISSAHEIVSRMKRGGRASARAPFDLVSTRILLLHSFVSSCWSTWREKICLLTFSMLEASTLQAEAEVKAKHLKSSMSLQRMTEAAITEEDLDNRVTALGQPRRGRQAIRFLKKEFRSRGLGDVAAVYVFLDAAGRNRISISDMIVGLRRLRIPEKSVDLESVFALSSEKDAAPQPQLREMAFIRLFSWAQSLKTVGTELQLLGKPFFVAIDEARGRQKQIIATVMDNVAALRPEEEVFSCSESENWESTLDLLWSSEPSSPSLSSNPTWSYGRYAHGTHSTTHGKTPGSGSNIPSWWRPTSEPSSQPSSVRQRRETSNVTTSASISPSLASEGSRNVPESAAEDLPRCSFCGGVHVLANDQPRSRTMAPPPVVDTWPTSPLFAARAARVLDRPHTARRLHMPSTSDSLQLRGSPARSAKSDLTPRDRLVHPPPSASAHLRPSPHRASLSPSSLSPDTPESCTKGEDERPERRPGRFLGDGDRRQCVGRSLLGRGRPQSAGARMGRHGDARKGQRAGGTPPPEASGSGLGSPHGRHPSAHRGRRRPLEGTEQDAVDMLSEVLEHEFGRRLLWGRGTPRHAHLGKH